MSSSLTADRKRSSADSGTGGGSPSKRQQQHLSDSKNETTSSAATSSTSSTCIISSQSSSLTLLYLPDNVRLGIFQFAPIEDLANIAMTCRQLREDCRHATLSQTRIATVDCCERSGRHFGGGSSFLRALNIIHDAERNGVFHESRFKVLKFTNHTGLAKVANRDVPRHIRQLRLSATSLDLSVMPLSPQRNDGTTTTTTTRPRRVKKDYEIPASYPKILRKIMPQLKEVNLSGVSVTQSALSDFARNCPLLEIVYWNYCQTSSPFASGHDLKACTNLRELYMDDFNFYIGGGKRQEQDMFFDTSNLLSCPLSYCAARLGRVSLLRAVYHLFEEKKLPPKPFTQQSLIKFVRIATNLNWFRSDLTPDNVAILKQERPEITFV